MTLGSWMIVQGKISVKHVTIGLVIVHVKVSVKHLELLGTVSSPASTEILPAWTTANDLVHIITIIIPSWRVVMIINMT